MKRSTAGLLVALGILAAPLSLRAQPPAKAYRIGFLGVLPPSALPFSLGAFRQGLSDLGYVEGQNIVIDYRWTEGKTESLADLVAELVRLQADVIVTSGTPAVRAAKNATTTIPIVMVNVGDPIGDDLIASLARPGGNLTGLSNSNLDLAAKRLELLKECVPKVSRVGVLLNPTLPNRDSFWRVTQGAAQALGVRLHAAEVRSPAEFEGAFLTMTRERAGAVLVIPDPLTVAYAKEIVGLATKHRLPGIYPSRRHAEAGGLLSYGASQADLYRRANAQPRRNTGPAWAGLASSVDTVSPFGILPSRKGGKRSSIPPFFLHPSHLRSRPCAPPFPRKAIEAERKAILAESSTGIRRIPMT